LELVEAKGYSIIVVVWFLDWANRGFGCGLCVMREVGRCLTDGLIGWIEGRGDIAMMVL
jgi:hypothetical protein